VTSPEVYVGIDSEQYVFLAFEEGGISDRLPNPTTSYSLLGLASFTACSKIGNPRPLIVESLF
jgi:hypothetical protein